MVALNKDAERDLEVIFDFGARRNGGVEIKSLRAPTLDTRGAYIVHDAKHNSLERGKYLVTVPHGSGIRLPFASRTDAAVKRLDHLLRRLPHCTDRDR